MPLFQGKKYKAIECTSTCKLQYMAMLKGHHVIASCREQVATDTCARAMCGSWGLSLFKSHFWTGESLVLNESRETTRQVCPAMQSSCAVNWLVKRVYIFSHFFHSYIVYTRDHSGGISRIEERATIQA